MRYNPTKDCKVYFEWPEPWEIKPWFIEPPKVKKKPKIKNHYEECDEEGKQITIPYWRDIEKKLFKPKIKKVKKGKKRGKGVKKRGKGVKKRGKEVKKPGKRIEKPQKGTGAKGIKKLGKEIKDKDIKKPEKSKDKNEKPEDVITEADLHFEKWPRHRRKKCEDTFIRPTCGGLRFIKVSMACPLGWNYRDIPMNLREVREVNKQEALQRKKEKALKRKQMKKEQSMKGAKTAAKKEGNKAKK